MYSILNNGSIIRYYMLYLLWLVVGVVFGCDRNRINDTLVKVYRDQMPNDVGLFIDLVSLDTAHCDENLHLQMLLKNPYESEDIEVVISRLGIIDDKLVLYPHDVIEYCLYIAKVYVDVMSGNIKQCIGPKTSARFDVIKKLVNTRNSAASDEFNTQRDLISEC